MVAMEMAMKDSSLLNNISGPGATNYSPVCAGGEGEGAHMGYTQGHHNVACVLKCNLKCSLWPVERFEGGTGWHVHPL